MADMSVNEMKMEEAAEAAPVSVEKQIGETAITFDVAVPYTIASDGKVQTIEIQRSRSPPNTNMWQYQKCHPWPI